MDSHLGALKKLGLSSSDVLLLAAPGAQHGRLKSTTVREGQSPRLHQVHLVDEVQVHGGFLFRLSTRQESDAFITKTEIRLASHILYAINKIYICRMYQ